MRSEVSSILKYKGSNRVTPEAAASQGGLGASGTAFPCRAFLCWAYYTAAPPPPGEAPPGQVWENRVAPHRDTGFRWAEWPLTFEGYWAAWRASWKGWLGSAFQNHKPSVPLWVLGSGGGRPSPSGLLGPFRLLLEPREAAGRLCACAGTAGLRVRPALSCGLP